MGLLYSKSKDDNTINPEHYLGAIETIDYIRDKLTDEQYLGYLLANVLKYVSRYNKHNTELDDLKKAYTYLGWAVEFKANEGNSAE